MQRLVSLVVLMAAGCAAAGPGFGAEKDTPRVPVIYSTDLFHPHDDPDDHFDLATLFGLPELDLRAIILDLGAKQKQKTGRPAVEQMMHITGRKAASAFGLARPLGSRTDRGEDQPAEFQGGVELILRVLRESPRKVTLFTAGSCRDMAAAANREPELFRAKVGAFYANAGDGPAGPQQEYNVGLDREAYARIFELGVPVYWCPCFGKDGYLTHFAADQAAVIGACAPRVQNYFVFCLTLSKAEPIAFLTGGPHPVPGGQRAMWCTAPLFHAAGRGIYRRGDGDFAALPAAEAGLAAKQVQVFRFVPARIAVQAGPAGGPPRIVSELNPRQPNGYVFQITDAGYPAILASCLKNHLAKLGR
ncbi:MAG: nucleoside hydrolase [Thermoguttaceae bacterium]